MFFCSIGHLFYFFSDMPGHYRPEGMAKERKNTNNETKLSWSQC